jgi:hypothetical protein
MTHDVYIEGPTVTVAELAAAVKRTEPKVRADCADLGLFVGVDWAGRPAIAEGDAHGIASGRLRERHEHDVAWRGHQAATEAWEADRERARTSAAERVLEEARRLGRGGPIVDQDAREAGREAAFAFERSNKAPRFNGEATAASWLPEGAAR